MLIPIVAGYPTVDGLSKLGGIAIEYLQNDQWKLYYMHQNYWAVQHQILCRKQLEMVHSIVHFVTAHKIKEITSALNSNPRNEIPK